MSDALPLPPRPNLEQYRKLAKDLHRACKSGDPAILEWAAHWAETLAKLREREMTPELQRELRRGTQRLAHLWGKMHRKTQPAVPCSLSGAQFFIARAHGFKSWPEFTAHLEALARDNSAASQFEKAVDAIVRGDADTLQALLRANPKLVRERSAREHRSTLLHYVSANGVEDFRQKTPPNIVEIARLLLDAGADVDAESDAYGGRSATLGLTATSCHPEDAGVQRPLMELLIEHGAAIDPPNGGSAVNDCLHNGRGQAAEFLADRGARLDLEAAAGVGRLEVVQSFFDATGTLKPTFTPKQMVDGFTWACEFGRTSVVDFLLRQGIGAGAKLPHHGATGLHWAAYEGHSDTVALLLERGAPVDIRDDSFEGTPLGWALYRWGQFPAGVDRGSHHRVVEVLVRAGAKLDASWFEVDDEDRRRSIRKLQSDPRMQAALATVS